MYASEEEARIDVSRILGSIGERLEHFCGRARFWNRGTRHGSRSGKSDTSRNVVVLHETTTKRAIPDPFKFFSVWFAQKKNFLERKKTSNFFRRRLQLMLPSSGFFGESSETGWGSSFLVRREQYTKSVVPSLEFANEWNWRFWTKHESTNYDLKQKTEAVCENPCNGLNRSSDSVEGFYGGRYRKWCVFRCVIHKPNKAPDC